jgi:polyphosphate glucokinase
MTDRSNPPASSSSSAGSRRRAASLKAPPPTPPSPARTRAAKGIAAKATAAKGPARALPARRPTANRPAATTPIVPAHPSTLAIDIGGTGLKASVLDVEGRLLAQRVRVTTTYPVTPEQMVDQLVKLVQPLPTSDRASVGFPGVVRRGKVLTAPHFVTKSGPGSDIVSELVTKWAGFDLAGALSSRLGVDVRVANDADLQGWAVVSGRGLEMVVTLGTGVGTALFAEGRLAPHLELAHHPFRKGETYNDQIGDAALKKIGVKKWRKRVLEAIANFDSLVNYDHLYLGGGNARHMADHIESSVTIVDNVAGIVGGIKLWELGGH